MSLFPERQDFTALVDLNASSYQENIPAANGVRSEVALSVVSDHILISPLFSYQAPNQPYHGTTQIPGEPRHGSGTTQEA